MRSLGKVPIDTYNYQPYHVFIVQVMHAMLLIKCGSHNTALSKSLSRNAVHLNGIPSTYAFYNGVCGNIQYRLRQDILGKSPYDLYIMLGSLMSYKGLF